MKIELVKKLFTAVILLTLIEPLSAQNREIFVKFRKDTLFGFADTTGKIVVEPLYSQIEHLYGTYDYFKFWGGEGNGLLNSENEILLQPKYQHIQKIGGVLIGIKNEKKDFFSLEGKEINYRGYASITPVKSLKDYILVTEDSKKWGIAKFDSSEGIIGDLVAEPVYNHVRFNLPDSTFEVSNSEYKSFFKLNSDNSISELDKFFHKKEGTENEFAPMFRTENSPISKIEAIQPSEWKFTLIARDLKNRRGVALIKIKYPRTMRNYNDIINPEKTEFDTLGVFQEIITPRIPQEYKYLEEEHPLYYKNYMSWAIVKTKNGEAGALNGEGETIIPFEYEDIKRAEFTFDCKSPALVAKKEGKWGVINFSGEILIPFKYKDIVPNRGIRDIESSLDCFLATKLLIVKEFGSDTIKIIDKNEKIIHAGNYDRVYWTNVNPTPWNIYLVKNKKNGLLNIFTYRNKFDETEVHYNILEPMSEHRVLDCSYLDLYPLFRIYNDVGFLGYADRKGFYYFSGIEAKMKIGY